MPVSTPLTNLVNVQLCESVWIPIDVTCAICHYMSSAEQSGLSCLQVPMSRLFHGDFPFCGSETDPLENLEASY